MITLTIGSSGAVRIIVNRVGSSFSIINTQCPSPMFSNIPSDFGEGMTITAPGDGTQIIFDAG